MAGLAGLMKGASAAFAKAKPLIGKAKGAGNIVKANAGKIKTKYQQVKSRFKGYQRLKDKDPYGPRLGSSIDIGDISRKGTPKLKSLVTRNNAVKKSIRQYKQKRLAKRIGPKNSTAKGNFMNRVKDQGLVGKLKEAKKTGESFKNTLSDAALDAYNRRLILQQMGLVPDNLIPQEQQRVEQTTNDYIKPYLRK
jgi:hypothetical protein